MYYSSLSITGIATVQTREFSSYLKREQVRKQLRAQRNQVVIATLKRLLRQIR